MKFLLLSVFLAVVVTVQEGVHGGILDDARSAVDGIVDTAKGAACMANNLSKFNECKVHIDEKQAKESEIKAYCCAYREFQVCVENVARANCGSDAKSAVQAFTTSVNKALPDDCQYYQSIWTCTDPIVLAVAIGIIVVVGIALLSCVCCCLKRMCA